MSMGERSYSVLYALPVQQPHVCGYSSCDIVVLDVNNPLVNTLWIRKGVFTLWSGWFWDGYTMNSVGLLLPPHTHPPHTHPSHIHSSQTHTPLTQRWQPNCQNIPSMSLKLAANCYGGASWAPSRLHPGTTLLISPRYGQIKDISLKCTRKQTWSRSVTVCVRC